MPLGLGPVRHRAEGVDLPVAVPGVVAGATLANLRRAVTYADKVRIARRQRRRTWLRVGSLAEIGLHRARRHLSKLADDQGCDARNVGRRHRGALEVAVDNRRLFRIAGVLLHGAPAELVGRKCRQYAAVHGFGVPSEDTVAAWCYDISS